MLICWDCGVTVTFTATTPAAEQWPDRYVDNPVFTRAGIPAEHTARLLRSRGPTGRLPASIPPMRVAGVWLHVERLLDLYSTAEVLEWLVADDDGNVLGEIWVYFGPRGAQLHRWGAPTPFGAPVAAGDGCVSRGAAVRRLLAAVLPADDDDDGAAAPREEEQG